MEVASRPPHPLGALDRRPLTAFGVYVHVPFCRERCDYCAFATYTDRDHLMERYADACVLELQRAVGAGDLAPATSVFFGGGTPSRLHPDTLCRILDAIPRRPGRRGDGRVQSRGRRRRAPRRLPAGRRDPRLLRPAVDPRPRPGRPRPPPRAARRRDGRRRGGGRRLRHLEPRSDLRRGHRERRRLGRHARPRPRAGPPAPAPLGLRPDGRARHAAGPGRRRAIPTRTRRPGATSGPSGARGRRLRLGGDLELGPARPRVPAQPPLLGAGRLRRHRVGGALAPRRGAVVERADARPLHRRRRGRPLARGRPRGADRRRSASSRRSRSRCARRAACRGTAWSAPRSSRASSSASGPGPC